MPEAVAEIDEKTTTAYRQSFDKKHRVLALSELQPGDAVHAKLDQQKQEPIGSWKKTMGNFRRSHY